MSGSKKKKMGRRKKQYRTTVVRIPDPILDEVMDLKLGYELDYDMRVKTIHPMPVSHVVGLIKKV